VEREITFHFLATRLLQRYGHLMPAVNPDSGFGKEQYLILKERGKAKGFRRGADTGFRRGAQSRLATEVLGSPKDFLEGGTYRDSVPGQTS